MQINCNYIKANPAFMEPTERIIFIERMDERYVYGFSWRYGSNFKRLGFRMLREAFMQKYKVVPDKEN